MRSLTRKTTTKRSRDSTTNGELVPTDRMIALVAWIGAHRWPTGLFGSRNHIFYRFLNSHGASQAVVYPFGQRGRFKGLTVENRGWIVENRSRCGGGLVGC